MSGNANEALQQGAMVINGNACFRVWAPAAQRLYLQIEAPRQQRLPMRAEPDGFFSAEVSGLGAGALYRYAFDDGRICPDPASRYQPEGPHGPSLLVDRQAWQWRDHDWRGVELQGQVIYEMHIGTFTAEGTFAAAQLRLPYLQELGVTLLEILPVAEFPGRWNWGYDGVNLFAPYHGYGEYDAFKRFVDAAHALGIGVILDVVYNHLGPDGNYLAVFSPQYFTDRYTNEWGDAINFDGEHSAQVREFYLRNAVYWIEEFHLDGLRLDATQSIHDAGPRHLLAEMSERMRSAAGLRSIVLIAENEPQRVLCLRPTQQGGHGLDAMWNDDFHHAARVALSGSREGYYCDYEGTAQEFIAAAKRGFLFQGQYYRWQRQRRGTRVSNESAASFIHFLQNHDQVANTLRGERIGALAAPSALRALTALLLLMPQTPMLFMGQEFGATQPFPFFADHNAELAPAVFNGRREFLAQFPSYALPASQAVIPDPGAAATFLSAKLQWPETPEQVPLYRLHRDLLRLRRSEPSLAAQARALFDGAVLSPQAFALRWFGPGRELLLIVNLGPDQPNYSGSEPLLADVPEQRWQLLWSSGDPDYGGSGALSPYTETGWRLSAMSASLLSYPH